MIKTPENWEKIVKAPVQFAVDHVRECYRSLGPVQKPVPKLENTIGRISSIPPALTVSGINIKNIIQRLHGKRVYKLNPIIIAQKQQQ